MAEWTSDANEYLEGYLHQVAALARSQGDDGEDIVAGLREHIMSEVEYEVTGLVTVDQLRKTLASVGTPEQVVSPDFTLQPRGRKVEDPRRPLKPGPLPPPRREPALVINAPPAKSRTGCWLALATVVVLVIVGPIVLAMLGIVAGITLPAASRAREAAQRAACQNNLKQIAVACKEFAGDHDGMFPALLVKDGQFCMEPTDVYPKYLSDPAVLTCPSDKNPPPTSASVVQRFEHGSYVYLGYIVTNEQEGRAFVEACRARLVDGGAFGDTLPAAAGSPADGPREFLRLRENPASAEADASATHGISHLAAAEIPIMFDRSFMNHVPGGINVLYLDGHVEFLKNGAKWPAQAWFLDALADL